MYNFKNQLMALALGAFSATALAQGEMVESGSEYRGSWGVSGEMLSIDSEVAALNGIDDSGYGLGVSYSGEKGLFNFTTGLSFFFIDDNARFRQDVENSLTGKESTEKSSIDAGSIYIDAGIQYPVSDSFRLGLNGGYRYFDIDRSISNCRDCYSQNIDVESDTYIKPFVGFDFSERVSGNLAYFSYTGDKGAESSAQFEVRASF